ncbi:hypothetical protein OHA21_00475 [Actinoplanes sp. NBC_00393]|uniref:hypothetical protein n=1 Tax=Actinoplanes sp. NBC_00393 TaxID=2975953 RepID=UPI002E1DC2BD
MFVLVAIMLATLAALTYVNLQHVRGASGSSDYSLAADPDAGRRSANAAEV